MQVLKRMNLTAPEADLSPLKNFLAAADACVGEVHIAIVGKYVSLPDAYLSVIEALGHAAVANGVHAPFILLTAKSFRLKQCKQP